jgi:hypothetical protein
MIHDASSTSRAAQEREIRNEPPTLLDTQPGSVQGTREKGIGFQSSGSKPGYTVQKLLRVVLRTMQKISHSVSKQCCLFLQILLISISRV